MGKFIFEGRAWVFGDMLDADWQICSLETLAEFRDEEIPFTAEELGRICFKEINPEFAQSVSAGDFIVAGENMGYSASCLDGQQDDPHFIGAASLAIKGTGVSAVLCESSNQNFFMNSFNLGLPVVECRDLRNKVRQHDLLRVDLATGAIINLTSEKMLHFTPLPEPLLRMVQEGGLYTQLEKSEKYNLDINTASQSGLASPLKGDLDDSGRPSGRGMHHSEME